MKAREKEEDDLHLVPKRIVSLLEYEFFFGTAAPEAITVTIEDKTDGKGNVLDRKVNGAVSAPSPHNMYYAMQAYFANGGGPCYVVSADLIDNEPASVTKSKLDAGLKAIEKEDEITLIVFPEAIHLDNSNYAELMYAALQMCGKLQDRFTVMDLPIPDGTGTDIRTASDDFRDMSLPFDNLKYGACYAPLLETTFDYVFTNDSVTVVQIVDENAADTGGKSLAELKPADSDPGSGDLILYNVALSAIDRIPVVLPPSPLVVGQYAFVDNTRGVWKAPANVALTGVVRPTIKITNQEQDQLNVHSTGKSINAIRAFTGKGILIWGARTLAGNDNEWRYVSVRRYFNFAEESIKKASEQFVFEPNDANTWSQVRAMIENFLILQWRAGALAGAKPADAFFVNVGLGTTMTALDILEGRMNVEIGLAVVRPAEFIILKFSHKMQVS